MLKKLTIYIKSIFTSKHRLRQQLLTLEDRLLNVEKANLVVLKSLLELADNTTPAKKNIKSNDIKIKDKPLSPADKFITNILSQLNGGNKEPTYH